MLYFSASFPFSDITASVLLDLGSLEVVFLHSLSPLSPALLSRYFSLYAFWAAGDHRKPKGQGDKQFLILSSHAQSHSHVKQPRREAEQVLSKKPQNGARSRQAESVEVLLPNANKSLVGSFQRLFTLPNLDAKGASPFPG